MTKSDQRNSAKLSVLHVRKEYDSPEGPMVVLSDVSLELEAGRTLAVVGPSGSGKSTLLNIIGSLDRPTAGEVRLGELEVTALTENQVADYRARRVGFVFQDHHLMPQLTALENVILPTLALRRRIDGAHRARELLERVGLSSRMGNLPSQLSGGERQRVAIARALVNEPGLLLADEPTGNLDHEAADSVGSLFIELADEKGVSLIVVTHNLELARRFRRVQELRDGRLAEPAD